MHNIKAFTQSWQDISQRGYHWWHHDNHHIQQSCCPRWGCRHLPEFCIGVKIATVTIFNGAHGKLSIEYTNHGVTGNIHGGCIISDLGACSISIPNNCQCVNPSSHGSSWNLLGISLQPFIKIIHEPNVEHRIPLWGAQDSSTICAPCKNTWRFTAPSL